PLHYALPIWRAVGGSTPALRCRRPALTVFHPRSSFLRRAAAQVQADLRPGADQPAEIHQLIGAELVELRISPSLVQLGRPAIDWADAILPMIAAREVAAVAKQRSTG